MRTTLASVFVLVLPAMTLPAMTLRTAADSTPPAPPAPAAKPPAAPITAENGRFTMTPAADGFLRLDTRSGGVSLCTVSGGAAQCRSSADERAALEAEIARLSDENAKLKAGAGTAGGPQASSAPFLSNLPKDADVDRALGILDKVVRGMARMMKEVDTDTN